MNGTALLRQDIDLLVTVCDRHIVTVPIRLSSMRTFLCHLRHCIRWGVSNQYYLIDVWLSVGCLKEQLNCFVVSPSSHRPNRVQEFPQIF